MLLKWIHAPLGLVVATALSIATPAVAQEEFTLGPDDAWERDTPEPGTPAARILDARRALALGEPERARALATAFLDRFPSTPGRAEMLLVRGDALVEMGDEYKALFDYEAITRQYPGSGVFVQALEREYDIAVAYADGLRRKFFGTVRIINASEDAQELLIRIQERLPGSRLAEDAGMKLADFYFKNSEMRLASDAYDLFIQNYPRSNRIEKARERLIQSYMASYRGPRHDDAGLRDARRRLLAMQRLRPAAAQRMGAEALIVRIDESEARKLLVTAKWYLSVSDPISAELYLRQAVEQHPGTVASLDALRLAPEIISQMPAGIAAEAPDYQLLAEALLGKAGPTETGVRRRSEPAIPETRELEPERPIDATSGGKETS
ncbi:MAG: outer membrane protein assembly factor BamD [Phycisphaera sp.]|nr:outer membrane protein assembly factor BamD [Phycisphaera sp.]